MRSLRSAKFSEYVSTYALLNLIGVHDTTLIEKRDASLGQAVYVRDACDADTTLLVIPAHRVCSPSVLARIGTKVRYDPSWMEKDDAKQLDSGVISFLTDSEQCGAWVECAWRISLEKHRSFSHWWGWLQSVPSTGEFAAHTEAVGAQCRALHTELFPYYMKGRKKIEEEKRLAYTLIAHNNLMPPMETFSWAVDVLLTRGLQVPRAWPGDDSASTELAVVPYVDLVNGADGAGGISGREPNATVEVASGLADLPAWYTAWVIEQAKQSGRDGAADLQRVLDQPYCVCVTLDRPLQQAEEVILDYKVPCIDTGVLSESQDALLSRMLKYGF